MLWLYLPTRQIFVNLSHVVYVRVFPAKDGNPEVVDLYLDDNDWLEVTEPEDVKATKDCLSVVTVFTQLHPGA
jgi:hypothetical protein